MFSRFAIWNTIIGSSLLAMPWSVERAGLGLALILMLTVSTLAVYTAYRLLNVQLHHGMRWTDIIQQTEGISLVHQRKLFSLLNYLGDNEGGDVPHLCKMLLGTWAEIVSRISSFITIFGANVVYWILMSNCLYHFVGYIVGKRGFLLFERVRTLKSDSSSDREYIKSLGTGDYHSKSKPIWVLIALIHIR